PPPRVHRVCHGPGFRDEGVAYSGINAVGYETHPSRIECDEGLSLMRPSLAPSQAPALQRRSAKPPSLRPQGLPADDADGDAEPDRDRRQRAVDDVEPGGAVLAGPVAETG